MDRAGASHYGPYRRLSDASFGGALEDLWSYRGFSGECEVWNADVVEDTEAIGIDGDGIVDESLGVAPRNFYIEDGQVAFSGMTFHLSDPVAGHAQTLGQLESSARDERCQLVTKSQALLNAHPEKGSARVAKAVGQRIHRMIHIQEDLGDRTNVHDGFEKPKGRRKPTPALHNRNGADGVQGHVRYPREDDEPKCKENAGVQSMTDQL